MLYVPPAVTGTRGENKCVLLAAATSLTELIGLFGLPLLPLSAVIVAGASVLQPLLMPWSNVPFTMRLFGISAVPFSVNSCALSKYAVMPVPATITCKLALLTL